MGKNNALRRHYKRAILPIVTVVTLCYEYLSHTIEVILCLRGYSDSLRNHGTQSANSITGLLSIRYKYGYAPFSWGEVALDA